MAAKKCIKQNTSGPNVSWRAMIFLFHHDFRAHIAWSTTEDLELGIWSSTTAKSKVNKLYLTSLINDDVLKFDVSTRKSDDNWNKSLPMSDILVMQICQYWEQLLYDSFAFIFRKSPVRLSFQISMQTFALSVLHYKINSLWCVNWLIEFNDVWVADFRKDFNFSECWFLSLKVHELVSIIHLDCNLFTSGFMCAFFYHSVSSMTNLLSKMIIVDIWTTWCCKFSCSSRNSWSCSWIASLKVLSICGLLEEWLILSMLYTISFSVFFEFTSEWVLLLL